MKRPVVSVILLALVLMVLTSPARAEQNHAATSGDPDAGSSVLVDTTHRQVSALVLNSAQWIDTFFRNERTLSEGTATYLRLRMSSTSQEGELLKLNLRTRINLDLPLFDERVRLFFNADDDRFDPSQLAQEDQDVIEPLATEHEASAGLRYYLKSTLRNHISLNAGLRFRGATPVIDLEPRFRHAETFNGWDLRFTQRFNLRTDDNYRATTRLDLERSWRQFFLRTSVIGNWYKDEPGYYYGYHVSLFQPISRNRIVQYGWRNAFATRPTHVLTETRILVSYRQRIWKEWLFVEVSPQVALPRQDNYDPTLFFFLHVDVVFGAPQSFKL